MDWSSILYIMMLHCKLLLPLYHSFLKNFFSPQWRTTIEAAVQVNAQQFFSKAKLEQNVSLTVHYIFSQVIVNNPCSSKSGLNENNLCPIPLITLHASKPPQIPGWDSEVLVGLFWHKPLWNESLFAHVYIMLFSTHLQWAWMFHSYLSLCLV